MNRLSFFFILTLAVLLPWTEGCRNGPTSANGNGTNSNGWSEVTAGAPWAARYGLSGTVFNGNMWVVGGANGSGSVTNYYGDVWKSGDGKNWSETSSNAPFGGRYGSQVVNFVNGGVTQLYLIGGNQGGTLKNDVWTSPDGANWTQILANNPAITVNTVGASQFCPRQDFNAVVFNNLIWVFAGTNGTTGSVGLNDVWSSPDGVTWTQVLANNTNPPANTQFTPRWGAAAVSFNNNLYIMCGHNTYSSNTANETTSIWSSANGTNWSLLSNLGGPVYYHQLVVNNNLMWYTCGASDTATGALSNASSSADGINWTSASGPYNARFGHLSLAFNGHVWIMGGCNNTNGLAYYNDVWDK